MRTQREPVAPSPDVPSLDLRRVEEIFKGDQRHVQQFLEAAREEFTVLRQKLPPALADRDAETLRYLVHKATIMLDMLMLSKLKAYFEEAEALLEQADDQPLEAVRQRGEQKLDELLVALEEALR